MKFRMSQKPKMASTLRPGTMAFSMELLSPFMFWPMISAPASPKPSASREPILMMVFSRITVSMGSGDSDFRKRQSRSLELQRRTRPELSDPDTPEPLVATVLIVASELSRWGTSDGGGGVGAAAFSCWSLCSSSTIARAARGLDRIFSIFAIMRSMGERTYLLASLEKVMAPKPRRKQIQTVWAVFRIASIRDPDRRSNTNMKKTSFHSARVTRDGKLTLRSWYRSLSGQSNRLSCALMSDTPRMLPDKHLSSSPHRLPRSWTVASVRLHM
mmetsp:Transcript_27836/g.88021  ORF Transcript_27836/g.88021 Transcript_27836/m.88021 type:complete len:272 (-) Transcript_27836:126-941(-)